MCDAFIARRKALIMSTLVFKVSELKRSGVSTKEGRLVANISDAERYVEVFVLGTSRRSLPRR